GSSLIITRMPARCRRKATPVARSPPPRISTKLFLDMAFLGGFELLGRFQSLNFLLAQHVTERIQQKVDEHEKECITQREGRQTAAGIDDHAENIHRGL